MQPNDADHTSGWSVVGSASLRGCIGTKGSRAEKRIFSGGISHFSASSGDFCSGNHEKKDVLVDVKSK